MCIRYTLTHVISGASHGNVGTAAQKLLDQNMLVRTETHIGVVHFSRVGTPNASQDMISLATLAAKEGCDIDDRCWPLLFTTREMHNSHVMCCDLAAHGADMSSAHHTFKPTTFQYVRHFRRTNGMRDLKPMRADGTTVTPNPGGGRKAGGQTRSDNFFSAGSAGSAGSRGSGRGRGRGRDRKGDSKRPAEGAASRTDAKRKKDD